MFISNANNNNNNVILVSRYFIISVRYITLHLVSN